jgi:two-component system chemotaxis response regulator CheB
MTKVRVLIADDSVVYRSQIKAALSNSPFIEVVGAASNGRFAIERLLQAPVDLLILDLEMPEMDGIETLTEIRKRGFGCKVLVFSSSSKRGAEATMKALRLGASDFIPKPSGTGSPDPASPADPSEKIRALLIPKIEALFPTSELKQAPAQAKADLSFPKVIWDLVSPQIVVIGSSTGGPAVLEEIFSRLAPPLKCPIVIAQHMPPIFTATLAERLGLASGIPAQEATHGTVLKKDQIYLAPGDFHLRLTGTPQEIVAQLDQGPQINWVRPAVDPLFESASAIFKNRCLAFVLTGMGSDGKVGAEVIKRSGGAVVIQSEKSCTVFGMPGAVHAANAYDRIADPAEIANLLTEKVAPNSALKAAAGG